MMENKTIPEGVSAVPVMTPEEIEQYRNFAVTASLIPCKWMIDTGLPAHGNCRYNLAECDFPESPIWRGLTPEKPFRWKSRLCNLRNCKFFEPQ